MGKYQVDGSVLNSDLAVQSWKEATRWNGNNHISIATGSQWVHETLHKSSKGRYWLEHMSQWQGSSPSARVVSREEAALWLVTNDHEVPEDLGDIEVEE